MIDKLCAQCRICSFMPEQEDKPVLSWVLGGPRMESDKWHPVLFLDNCDDKKDIRKAMKVAQELLLGDAFDYTTTIRCDFMPGEMDMVQMGKAEDRCAVWTHQLLDNRLLIVSTVSGLKQMQAGDHSPGDLWRNSRLGVILCVPPLLRIPPRDFDNYRAKVQRAMTGEKVTA